MATVKISDYLQIWKVSRGLSKEIILLSKTTDIKHHFKLKDQIKDSATSVMDTIAKGFEKSGNGEFKQFLAGAKGSSSETRSHRYSVFNKDYSNKEKLNILVAEYVKRNVKIYKFIVYRNNTILKAQRLSSPKLP